MKWKRRETKLEKQKRWHRKFLWWPVLDEDDMWHWLEEVWVIKRILFSRNGGHYKWEYSWSERKPEDES